MKKKSLKSLNLNKKSISNLSQKSIKGGTIYTFGAVCNIVIVSLAICTDDCSSIKCLLEE
ncbi:hypothetical protein [uncultured Kordia sp.]|uniref:hypothetical protein n=1 Tax=uncultured Kordia sp. TaxID=507699 RepID=UPI00260402D7|nr:hypothetical protein [uncultured Kordia sp.]